MTPEVINELKANGIDYDGAMKRFMNNEGIFERVLKKFPGDQSFAELEKALAAKDYQAAFAASHTLKGLCGNLSLQSLYDVVYEQVEHLRAGRNEEGEAMMPRVTEEYNKVIAVLNRCVM